MHLLTDEYFVDNMLAIATRVRELTGKQTNASNLAVLTATVGNLADELINSRSWKPVYEEAVMVAAMALIIATEGDALEKPNHVNTRNM